MRFQKLFTSSLRFFRGFTAPTPVKQVMPVVTNVFTVSRPDTRPSCELSEQLYATSKPSSGLCVLTHASYGHGTPPGEWYDQTADEWCCLIAGTATLEVELDSEINTIILSAGDSLTLPAGMRHRVAQVSEDARWIAVHNQSPEEL